ncbi:MAG: 2-aminoethylphosphonate--pyruvate transaminase, partial [Betaproteobacteria bacterium]|nr:2-aminoethylphosphonate--pyruvate transaminase [Betaproteobacteria bacterium]
DRGFVLYPGKLTRAETFRVGCIGAIGRREIEQALHAIELAAKDLGLQNAQPLLT